MPFSCLLTTTIQRTIQHDPHHGTLDIIDMHICEMRVNAYPALARF
jgi:hypothetical protein